MPLFRYHRSSLSDSLKTTIIVTDIDHLRDVIIKEYLVWGFQPNHNNHNVSNSIRDFKIKIEVPYHLPLESSFDPRCGWYTHYVLADIIRDHEYILFGFLSEPINFVDRMVKP